MQPRETALSKLSSVFLYRRAVWASTQKIEPNAKIAPGKPRSVATSRWSQCACSTRIAAIVQPAADAPATQNGKGLDERMPVTVNVSTCPSTNREVLSPMLSDEGRLPQ